MDGSVRFAVAGNPIAHSISPKIFYKLFESAKISGFYSRIAADSFEEAIEVARMAGITGLNVTSPFKEEAAVCPIYSTLYPQTIPADRTAMSPSGDSAPKNYKLVGKLMAANTVVLLQDLIALFNTDYLGVYESIKNLFPATAQRAKKAFVVGAGGAGVAAAYGLSLAGFNVTVFNRSVSKAFEKIKWIQNCAAADLNDINKQIHDADIIVNALPVNDILFDLAKVKKDAIIFDANYKNSVLIKSAAEMGLQTISGLKWLVNQALYSFALFTRAMLPDNVFDLFTEENLVYDKKSNVSLIGFMGSGKTSAGKIVADLFKTDFIDIDKEIEKQEKMSIDDIFKNKNENYFRQLEKRITELVFNNEKGKVIACGGGAVKDNENRKIIAANSFPVWLISPPDVSIKRIEDDSRPLLNSGNKQEEALKLFNERIDFYGAASSLIIDSSKRSPLDIAKKLYEEISPVFKR